MTMYVTMDCDSLKGFPHFALPMGYTIRGYQAGDEAAWIQLHKIGDSISTCEFNEALFRKEFGWDVESLRSRMFYVVAPDGEIVGTTTAWFTDEETSRGRIHWVIVHPQHRQQGISKAMLGHAMQRLAQSHEQAMLVTSLDRPWAIKLYLDFGFLPAPSEASDPGHFDGWAALQKTLNHPRLADWLEQR